MKKLHFELNMGAAGDMLAAALYELLDETQKKEFIEKMNSLGLDGVSVSVEPSVKCGITGTHFSVKVGGAEEVSEDDHHYDHDHDHDHGNDHDHHHDHDHGNGHDHHHDHGNGPHHHHDHDHHHHHHDHEHAHSHEHTHRGLADIEHIVSHMPLSDECRKNVTAVYALIAEAESRAHGKPVELVHFHEVGALDAVADITAVCLLIEMLAPERITASPVCVGFGSVKCAHGILPVPAPATAHILTGIPVYAGSVEGELCTPTGAALIRRFAEEFETLGPMRISGIGYGMGKKDFAKANCVRAVIGETGIMENAGEIAELSCSVDDMTGEEIGFALDTFLKMGAKDAYYIPIGMKKSRPGVLVCVLCDIGRRDEFVQAVFKHTSTLGVRERIVRRYELSREMRTAQAPRPYGEVRFKLANGLGAARAKIEYEDIARVAREQGISFASARTLLESAIDG